MKKYNTCLTALALALALLIALPGCAPDGTDGGETASDISAEGNAVAAQGDNVAETLAYTANYCSEEDLDSSWDESSSTLIALSDSGIEITGSGASAQGSVVTISAAGTYVFSGSLSDGQIFVNAMSDDLVRIVLNGVDLSNSTTAPIYSSQADKTVIILADGAENRVTDAVSYIYDEGVDEPDAAIFAKDDLTITGNGSLTVYGNCNNGIGSKDTLRITGGSFSVTAVNDGIRGRDGIYVLDGAFTVDAQNDGFKANNDTDAAKGFIVIDGGRFYVVSGHDGIQAETDLVINGGSFDIYTGGGASSAVQTTSGTGGWGQQSSSAATDDSNSAESTSMKALKAGSSVTVNGGSFSIDAEDDAAHSNGDLTVNGGSFQIAAGDDGFHADNALVINGGEINITTSYEGLEGSTVDINDGVITVRATDDGINAAGGSDGESFGPRGMDSFSGAVGSYYIRISGGSIRIDADGDGIDSNGSLYFDGGTVYVDGPTDSGNGALDAEGTIESNGGTLVAVGSSAMHLAPGNSSSQPSISIYYTSTQRAGSAILLTDADGGAIIEFISAKEYQAAVISATGLAVGETYTLYSNGEQLAEITLDSAVTGVSSDGSAASGGMGGGRGNGGMGGDTASGEATMPERGEPPDGATMPDGAEPPEGGFSPGGSM